jgi:hypothetical protein
MPVVSGPLDQSGLTKNTEEFDDGLEVDVWVA